MPSYTLKILHGDSHNERGDTFYNKSSEFIIGQCDNANLRLENRSVYQDIDYCSILMDESIESWYLIRLSREAVLTVNGESIQAIHYLHNNDIISAGDVDIKFTISSDEVYSSGVTKVPVQIRKYITGILIPFAALLLLSAGVFIYSSASRNNEWKKIEQYISSVYRLEIPEIYVQRLNGEIYETIATIEDNSTVGTAFITSDGTIITARHCIEPWLSLSPGNIDISDSSLCGFVSRSITQELIEDDFSLRVVSHVKLIGPQENGISNTYDFLSSDFILNNERDIIINLGSRGTPSYWRSIRPSFQRKDCALDDIAFLPNSGIRGNILLADKKVLESLRRKQDIAIVGFATSTNTTFTADIKNGYIMRMPDISPQDGYMQDCILLNDDASAGDSGGPVLARYKRNLYVIAVVSRRDDIRTEKSGWSVPISEIYRIDRNE